MKLYINTEDKTVTVNGIALTFELLQALTNPNPEVVYRIRRVGNDVIVGTHVSLTEYTPDGMIQ